MTLIPIEHPRRLSVAEAESFFGALGSKVVSARGFHTADSARMTRLVEAIEPRREHSISFYDGVVDPAPLDALASAEFEYLDVRTPSTSLRIWPGVRAWVHGSRVDLDAATVPLALDTFHRLAGKEPITRGFISGVREPTKPLLLTFLARTGAEVDAVLEIGIGAARALTDLYRGEALDWQAGGVFVEFPAGRIHGFLVTPNVGDEARAKWRARIDRALRRASLT